MLRNCAMTVKGLSLLLIILCSSLTRSQPDMIEPAEWLAVSPQLNEVLDAIGVSSALSNLTRKSYDSNLGSSSFEKFAHEYREYCGNPMESYARERNITSEGSCLWKFILSVSQDTVFVLGPLIDRTFFSACADWLMAENNAADHMIIGMWAIYENKAHIINETGIEDCE